MRSPRALVLAPPLLVAAVLTACGSGGGTGAPPSAPAAPTPVTANAAPSDPSVSVTGGAIPNVPIPSVQIPNVQIPSVQIPSAPIPDVQIPQVPFPEIRFPKVDLPEITLPDITVQQGDDGGRPTTVYTVPADVLFDFDKADIRPDADEALRQISASLAQRAPKAQLEIRGHTDSMGDDAYNLALSERRARSVEGWLAARGGVDAGRMQVRGFGEAQPVAPNTHPDGSDDPAGRQRNRRVEIVAR